MNSLSKVLVSIIGVLVIGFVGILLYIYWPAITGTVNGNKYYTAEDVQDSYDKGYSDGNTSEKELNEKLAYYKSLVDEYYTEVNTLNGEIDVLNNDISNKQEQIVSLETQKSGLLEQVSNLTTIKTNNEETISSLNTQIEGLQKQVQDLSKSEDDKSKEIARLTEQISNLQALTNQLQQTNQLNVETINGLNNQIKSLNTQISEMSYQINNSSSILSSLNAKIKELEKSVAYYEEYIANLENGEQVVATFEFNGSVYNIQIVNKNDIVSVTTPTSTEYVVFNYWTVNGEQVDLSTYQITQNTKFVANVTLKYLVTFNVDGSEYSKQVIIKDNKIESPETPTKDGYEFDGWSINGVDIIDLSTFNVTEHITFNAIFTKLHTVTFMVEDKVVSTQSVRNGEFATNVEVENTDYKVFNGWKVNNTLIDVGSYKITSATTIIADITYSYDVKFLVDNETFNSQIIVKNKNAIIPTEPTKQGYEFDGWTLDGVNIIDVSKYNITSNTNFIAKFTKIYEVNFVIDDEIVDSQSVRNGNFANFISSPNQNCREFLGWYVLDEKIDVTKYSITNDTVFIAKFNNFLKVRNTGNETQIVELGSSTIIPDKLFESNENIISVEMPDCITVIGYRAFYQCRNLASINLPSKLIEIGASAFVSTMANFNFTNCVNLKSIGGTAFTYCTNISELNFVNTKLEVIGERAFSNNSSAFANMALLKRVILPNTLKTIENGAFSSSTKYLEVFDFSRCSNLETIGDEAFQSVDISLIDLTYCTKLNYIGNNAFFQYYDSQGMLCTLKTPYQNVELGINAFHPGGYPNPNTIFINNATLANSLTDADSCGCLIKGASIVYIKDNFDISQSSYLISSYTQITSDVSGYAKYQRN